MAASLRETGIPRARGRRAARLFARGALTLLLLVAAGGVAFPGTAFPIEMKDDRGVAVRLPAPPRRVVSLAPSLTEIVFSLGRRETLVGVTRYCNFPLAALKLPKIGGVADPDVERIVAASPGLVLCTTDGNPREKVRALEALGIPCFCTDPQDLAGIFATIERIGMLLGVPDRARREAQALRKRAARASIRKGTPGPRVLFVVSTSPIIAAGRGTFMDELIRKAGGRNAADAYASRYPRLTVEDLVAAAPDLILVAAMAGVEKFPPEVTRWKEVPAFRDGAVFSLDGDLVTRPGPRMVAALEEVSRIVTEWDTRHAPGRAGKPGEAR